PAGAAAAEQTLTFTTKAIHVDPFAVARGTTGVPTPGVNGYVVGMTADIVDLNGETVPYARVMLHHVVFANVLHSDLTCPTVTDFSGNSSPVPVERFWAEGEEHTPLALPAGYGYPTTTRDLWGLLYMLMNHHAQAET